MGILKGLLSSDSQETFESEDMQSSAFASAEAALDRAIKELHAAAPGSETLGTGGKPVSSGDRRQGDGVRPDGLPERRSGAERRTGSDRRGPGVEFGRRR